MAHHKTMQDADGNYSSKRVGGSVTAAIGLVIVGLVVYKGLTCLTVLPNLHYIGGLGLSLVLAGLSVLTGANLIESFGKFLSSLQISQGQKKTSG